jgi:hypothetical protein
VRGAGLARPQPNGRYRQAGDTPLLLIDGDVDAGDRHSTHRPDAARRSSRAVRAGPRGCAGGTPQEHPRAESPQTVHAAQTRRSEKALEVVIPPRTRLQALGHDRSASRRRAFETLAAEYLESRGVCRIAAAIGGSASSGLAAPGPDMTRQALLGAGASEVFLEGTRPGPSRLSGVRRAAGSCAIHASC